MRVALLCCSALFLAIAFWLACIEDDAAAYFALFAVFALALAGGPILPRSSDNQENERTK